MEAAEQFELVSRDARLEDMEEESSDVGETRSGGAAR